MLGRTAQALVLMALVGSIVSCRKLDAPGAIGTTGVPSQPLRGVAAIPGDWGHLVSVTTESTYPDLMQLWFEDNSGNVRMVAYRLRTGELLNVSVFRRQ